MSDSNLSNPKVALGIAGVVVAIALVASVALREFSPKEPDPVSPDVVEQVSTNPANAAPVQSGFAPPADAGWADDDGISNDWGGGSNLPDEQLVSEGFGPSTSADTGNSVGNSSFSSPASGGPTITTRTAPGAPPVVSPNAGPKPELEVVGG